MQILLRAPEIVLGLQKSTAENYSRPALFGVPNQSKQDLIYMDIYHLHVFRRHIGIFRNSSSTFFTNLQTLSLFINQSVKQRTRNRRLSKFLRTIDDVTTNCVIYNDNFVPEITSYLKRFEKFSVQISGNIKKQLDKRKQYADQHRKSTPEFNTGLSLRDFSPRQ
ncbi:hypothetical protein CEXT_593291 [Caerostris extrusa]|uniref:Uncharacterized protein n=1 Tax=Caerostris extrusa TaxID=172846 RepID=A0AAV4T1A9_CAEEX|nr:hypothetical protein CEXT_593291 [Caerostris extrusa]